MKENKKICGHCASFSESGVCRKTGKDMGLFNPGNEKCFEGTEKGQGQDTDILIDPVKVCKSCLRELPLSAFGRHARSKDGFQSACLECARRRRKRPGPKKPVQVKEGWTHEAYHRQPASPSDRLLSFTDAQLFDELVRRGFRGKMEKAVTLTSDGHDKIDY